MVRKTARVKANASVQELCSSIRPALLSGLASAHHANISAACEVDVRPAQTRSRACQFLAGRGVRALFLVLALDELDVHLRSVHAHQFATTVGKARR